MLFRVWHIINAMLAPRMAAQDAAHCEPAAFKRAMTFQSGQRIGATGGIKAATAPNPSRENQSIAFYRQRQYPGQ